MKNLSRRLCAVLLAAFAGCGLAPVAWADRPLVSETADVIPSDACQVEAGWASLRVKASPNVTATDVMASCGNRWNSQFGIGLGQARSAGARVQGAVLLGKTTLIAPEEGRTGLGLAYAIGAEREAGKEWLHADTRVLAAVTRTLTKGLLGHANLGWVRTQSDRLSTTIWSLGLEGDHELKWAADLYGDDRSKPWASFGLLFPVVDKVSLNLAYARQLGGERTQQVTLGGKIEF